MGFVSDAWCRSQPDGILADLFVEVGHRGPIFILEETRVHGGCGRGRLESLHVAEVGGRPVRTRTRRLEPGHVGPLLFSGAERAREDRVEVGRAVVRSGGGADGFVGAGAGRGEPGLGTLETSARVEVRRFGITMQ